MGSIWQLDANASNPFYCQDGKVFNTLAQLKEGLESMPEWTFNHHVNHERNDFANWVEGCFGAHEKALGAALRNKSRAEMLSLFSTEHGPPMHERAPPSLPEPHIHAHAQMPAPEHHAAHHAPPTMPAPSQIIEPPISSIENVAAELQKAAQVVIAEPLPPPIIDLSERRIHWALSGLKSLHHINHEHPAEAREQFIRIRNTVWQEFSQEERDKVLPMLREVYELLR